MTDFIQCWLNTAGRHPLLPKSEIIRLAKRRDTLTEGSPQYIKIVNKICIHNLRLIPGVVRAYLAKRKTISMNSEVASDLLQQGYIGLRRAAEKYDGKRGFTFSTYAYSWIYQAVSRWHNSCDRLIYVPETSMNEALYRQRHGKPSNSKNGKIKDGLIDAVFSVMSVSSLDKSAPDEEDRTLLDLINEDNLIISRKNTAESDDSALRALKEVLSACAVPPLAQDVVLLYTKRPHMAMVGAKVKKHPKTCRQMYDDAIKAMKSYAESKEIASAGRMKYN